jgi:hypothetical protein
MRVALAIALASAVLSGCLASPDTWGSGAVAYHMRMADSLEEAMSLQLAAAHYAAVAEEYPLSAAYPYAVRKAALLYANEFNPARNDTLALHWFKIYLGLSLRKAERENVQATASLLQRVVNARERLARLTRQADSLTVVSRAQAGTLGADARRIQALESELEQAQRELQRMKEIDLQLSKSRGRR